MPHEQNKDRHALAKSNDAPYPSQSAHSARRRHTRKPNAAKHRYGAPHAGSESSAASSIVFSMNAGNQSAP